MSGIKQIKVFSKLKEFSFIEGGSSKGVLAKCFVKDSEGDYLLKTGRFLKPNFSNLEPITECICSDLLDLFKITHAKYELEYCICKESDLWKAKKILVCKTKLFTDVGNILIPGEKVIGNERDYNKILGILGNDYKLDIDDMIVFDYLVNNTDRHHNNFGLLLNSKKRTKLLAPLFDHGFSLLSDFDSYYLETVDFDEVYEECDYSKFCNKSNLLQLKNVNKFTFYLDLDEQEINRIFLNYENYLPKWRLDLMREVFYRRLSYVRKSFIKDGEYYIRRDK